MSHWTEAGEIVASVDEVIENAERHVQERLDKGEKSQFCFQISHRQMMIKSPWHPHM